MLLKYNGKNIALAKDLRKEATPQENHLWYDFLSKHKCRFQRQKAIDNFIVDFYCAKARLVIELDGSRHFTSDGKRHDRHRTEVLERYRLKVIRFTNSEVDKNFEGVCSLIDRTIKERME